MYLDRGVNDRVLIKVHDSRDAWIGSTLSSEHILTNTIEVRGPPRKVVRKSRALLIGRLK